MNYYHDCSQVKQEKLAGSNKPNDTILGADFIRSEYRLAAPTPSMQQREILSESTVRFQEIDSIQLFVVIIYNYNTTKT